ncbi:MAG: hypothetical protein HQK57_02550 [Deltaproteobacteria bacterium]|nr:hypothetical protein [Deltaproteobacteria bacterium]MBF0524596.1 hypothetical protein [Deltaproteobacteria bacterium]
MPIMPKDKFPEVIAGLQNKGTPSSLYLLYGEEYLYKAAARELVDTLVPKANRSFNLNMLDGDTENVFETISLLRTFGLMPGYRVTWMKNSQIFYSRQDAAKFFLKSQEAYQAGDNDKAGRYLLHMLAMAAWKLEDVKNGAWRSITSEEWKSDLGFDRDEGQAAFLDPVIAHCVDRHLTIVGSDAKELEAAIKTGWPGKNILVISTDTVDKRTSLYKTIEKAGVVIEFALDAGRSTRDRQDAENKMLMEQVDAVLTKSGKMMEPRAKAYLLSLTGFNLRALSTELEKVVGYVGQRSKITLEDVEKTAVKSKENALYELQEAIVLKDVSKGLKLIEAMLDQGLHTLQVLAALTTQVRRLILARDVLDNRGIFTHGMNYPTFQKDVHSQLSVKKGSAEENSFNTMGPYPMFLLLQKAKKFTLAELFRDLELLLEADLELKGSPPNPTMVLEKLTIDLCRPS